MICLILSLGTVKNNMKIVIKTKRYDENDKLIKLSGESVFRDIKFKINVHRASVKKAYRYVLKASVISPDTNRILQMGGKRYNDFVKKIERKLSEIHELEEKVVLGSPEQKKLEKTRERIEQKKKRLKEGLPLEALNADSSVYLIVADDKTIEAAGERLIMRLYGDFQEDISKALKRSAPAGDLHARTAYDMYQNDFFSTQPGTTEKVLRNKKNTLKDICNKLNSILIGSLSDSDIDKVAKQLKGDAKSKIILTEKFLDYAGENSAYTGLNPITRYLGHMPHGAGKKRSFAKLYPSVSTHISPNAEQELHDYLEQHILNEDMALGIILPKGYDMTMNRILSITWKDVLINGNEVRICDYRENYTGGTHNYIRPPTRETANFLIKKYNELYKKYGKTRLDKMLLVPVPGCSIL